MNPVEEVRQAGQSLWLDYISRGLIRSGGLKRLIEQSGITGLTSNPTIFERAIDETNDYSDALERLAATQFDARSVYESLSVEDVRDACDLLKPVHEKAGEPMAMQALKCPLFSPTTRRAPSTRLPACGARSAVPI